MVNLLSLRSACWTHRGRRPANQDAVLARPLPGNRDLLAVADGVGGHAAGDVASATALQVLAGEIEAGAALEEAFQSANTTLRRLAHDHHSNKGMGTTLVAVLRTGSVYEIANVGDSRAYWLDARSIRQITRDHSFVAEAVREARLSFEDAVRSPWRNVLTRALGLHAEVAVDLFGPFEIGRQPHAILLCSDGLYKALPDPDIHRCTLSAESARAAASSLASFAYLRGSTDNISAAMMEFGTLFRPCDGPTQPIDLRTLRARGPHSLTVGETGWQDRVREEERGT